jgi:hypothetical protein
MSLILPSVIDMVCPTHSLSSCPILIPSSKFLSGWCLDGLIDYDPGSLLARKYSIWRDKEKTLAEKKLANRKSSAPSSDGGHHRASSENMRPGGGFNLKAHQARKKAAADEKEKQKEDKKEKGKAKGKEKDKDEKQTTTDDNKKTDNDKEGKDVKTGTDAPAAEAPAKKITNRKSAAAGTLAPPGVIPAAAAEPSASGLPATPGTPADIANSDDTKRLQPTISDASNASNGSNDAVDGKGVKLKGKSKKHGKDKKDDPLDPKRHQQRMNAAIATRAQFTRGISLAPGVLGRTGSTLMLSTSASDDVISIGVPQMTLTIDPVAADGSGMPTTSPLKTPQPKPSSPKALSLAAPSLSTIPSHSPTFTGLSLPPRGPVFSLLSPSPPGTPQPPLGITISPPTPLPAAGPSATAPSFTDAIIANTNNNANVASSGSPGLLHVDSLHAPTQLVLRTSTSSDSPSPPSSMPGSPMGSFYGLELMPPSSTQLRPTTSLLSPNMPPLLPRDCPSPSMLLYSPGGGISPTGAPLGLFFPSAAARGSSNTFASMMAAVNLDNRASMSSNNPASIDTNKPIIDNSSIQLMPRNASVSSFNAKSLAPWEDEKISHFEDEPTETPRGGNTPNNRSHSKSRRRSPSPDRRRNTNNRNNDRGRSRRSPDRRRSIDDNDHHATDLPNAIAHYRDKHPSRSPNRRPVALSHSDDEDDDRDDGDQQYFNHPSSISPNPGSRDGHNRRRDNSSTAASRYRTIDDNNAYGDDEMKEHEERAREHLRELEQRYERVHPHWKEAQESSSSRGNNNSYGGAPQVHGVGDSSLINAIASLEALKKQQKKSADKAERAAARRATVHAALLAQQSTLEAEVAEASLTPKQLLERAKKYEAARVFALAQTTKYQFKSPMLRVATTIINAPNNVTGPPSPPLPLPKYPMSPSPKAASSPNGPPRINPSAPVTGMPPNTPPKDGSPGGSGPTLTLPTGAIGAPGSPGHSPKGTPRSPAEVAAGSPLDGYNFPRVSLARRPPTKKGTKGGNSPKKGKFIKKEQQPPPGLSLHLNLPDLPEVSAFHA